VTGAAAAVTHVLSTAGEQGRDIFKEHSESQDERICRYT